MADNENMVNEAEVEMITLEFDNDEKVECEILGVFEYDGQEYIALVPDDGSEDVYLYGNAEEWRTEDQRNVRQLYVRRERTGEDYGKWRRDSAHHRHPDRNKLHGYRS